MKRKGRHGGARAGAGRKAAPGESYEAARRRKESALADLREAEARRVRGALIDAEETARRWETVGREVQARVLAVTSRVRAQLPHLTVQDADVIDRELRAALTALSDGSNSLSAREGSQGQSEVVLTSRTTPIHARQRNPRSGIETRSPASTTLPHSRQ